MDLAAVACDTLTFFRFLFFATRLEHLIVSRFLETSADESFPERFVFIKSGTRSPVRRRFRNDFALLLGNIDTISRFLRRVGRGHSEQFTPCLLPIGIGKLLGIALINHGNFPGAFLYHVRRRSAEPVSMNGYFSISRTPIFSHHIEYGTRMQIVRMSKGKMCSWELSRGDCLIQ